MTFPDNSPEVREAMAGAGEACSALGDRQQNLPTDIFDAELFEDLRELLGDARIRCSLEEMAASLQELFPDVSAEALDREQIFRHAHSLVARAGMMGFTALRDACSALQQVCATGAPVGDMYANTRAAAMVTRDVIASLQERPL